jgi:hypothetical protein
MKLILRFVGKLNNWMLVCGTLVILFFGLISNKYFPTNLFILKIFLLLGILNILILSFRHYNRFIINDFIRASNDPVLSAEKLKMKKSVFANYNIVISLIVSLFFVIISIYLRFINFDITGYLFLVLLFITIFISIMGYMLNVHLVHFLYRLTNAEIEKYSKFYPAYTKWLINITKYSGTYQNSFFISGTLYVLLFTIHAPDDTLKILSFDKAYDLHDIILCISWIVIVSAVIIGFPITSYLKSKMIRNIVTNLKIKSSEYFETIVNKVEIDKQMDYIKLIKEIMESPDYPVKNRANIIISSTTLVLNLIITIQKIYPHVIE